MEWGYVLRLKTSDEMMLSVRDTIHVPNDKKEKRYAWWILRSCMTVRFRCDNVTSSEVFENSW